MGKLSKLIKSNSNLKTKISTSLKQGGDIVVKDNYLITPISQIKTTLVDDSIVKGGYHVVGTIEQRDAILCCYRKQGMKVVVVGTDYSFKEYVLSTSNCDENIWEEVIVNVDIDESEVNLVEDYSELGTDIQSQMELNIVLKNLLLQIQQDIQDVEVPTKTSDLQNDGADGVNPFITIEDIPEKSLVTNTDGDGITTLTQEGVNKLVVSKVGQTGQYNDLLDKPTIPPPVDISGKLDKPSQDGSWVVTKSGEIISYTDASNFGKNIGNSHITSIANSSFTLGANYTINTSGYFFNITNLPDKSTDSSFNLILAQNSSGQVAKSNGVQMMLNASNVMTDAQIDVWRENMKKTGETYSTGQPRIDIISPPVIDVTKNYVTPVTLLGLNMFLNLDSTSTMVRMLRVRAINNVSVNDSWIDVNNNITVHQTLPNLLSVNQNFYNYPQGYYIFEVTHNGLVSTSSAELLLTDTINSSVPNDLILSSSIGTGATISGKNIDIVGAQGSQNGIATTEIFKLSDFGNSVILKATINWGETNQGNGSFAASSSTTTSFGLGSSGQSASTTPSILVGVKIKFFCNHASKWVQLQSVDNNLIAGNTASNFSTDVYFIFNQGLVTLFIPQFSYSKSKTYTLVDSLSLYAGQPTDSIYYGTECGITLSQIIDI